MWFGSQERSVVDGGTGEVRQGGWRSAAKVHPAFKKDRRGGCGSSWAVGARASLKVEAVGRGSQVTGVRVALSTE